MYREPQGLGLHPGEVREEEEGEGRRGRGREICKGAARAGELPCVSSRFLRLNHPSSLTPHLSQQTIPPSPPPSLPR